MQSDKWTMDSMKFVFVILFLGAMFFPQNGHSQQNYFFIQDETRGQSQGTGNIPFQIPYGWDRKLQKNNNNIRLELKHSQGSIIVMEMYNDFQENLFEYKNMVWRKQKLQFHSLEKISDRNFSRYRKNNEPKAQQFLLISRFRYRGKLYIQRTMGMRSQKNAVIFNFIAPQRQFYKKVKVFNTFTSHVQRKLAQLKDPNSLFQPSQKDTEPKDSQNRPATDLNLDKNGNKNGNKKDSNKKSNKADDKHKNNDPNAIDSKDAKFDYYLLDNGNWGYCTTQSIKNPSDKYEKKKFFDGKKGWCSKEDKQGDK